MLEAPILRTHVVSHPIVVLDILQRRNSVRTNHIGEDVPKLLDAPDETMHLHTVAEEILSLLLRTGVIESKDGSKGREEARRLLRIPDSSSLLDPRTPSPILAQKDLSPKAALELLIALVTSIEGLLDPEFRRKEGIVYTPPTIAQSIVQSGLQTRQKGDSVSLLDPACGAGIFLLTGFLLQVRESIGAADTILTSHFGVDRDPTAIELATLILKAAFLLITRSQSPAPCLKTTVLQGDTLLESGWEETLRRRVEGFDLVVGNPPYGLARGEKLTYDENEELKRRYHSMRVGKLDKYLAFMAKGYSLLNDRGFLSYVVPNAWLGIRSGERIRERLLDDRSLTKIVILPQSAFKGRALETVIFEVHKGANAGNYTVSRWETKSSTTIPYEATRLTPGRGLPTAWSPTLTSLFSHLCQVSTPLARHSRFLPLIALQAYAVGKGSPPQSREIVATHAFHATTPLDATYLPYLKGQDVERYKVKWSGEYLSYGRWLAEYQALERYTQPRVVIREIIGKAPYSLIAAPLSGTYLYNRSVLHILSDGDNAAARAEALATILNSKLATVILAFSGRKTQRTLFPKIVNDDLHSFPLSQSFDSHVEPLATMARRLGSDSTTVLQEEADELVYDCYQLTKELRQGVEDALLIIPSR